MAQPTPIRLLNPSRLSDAVLAQGSAAAARVALEIVAETGSTNADLLARCSTLPGPTLRIAEQQTAGRGRAGRSWLSQPGATLMFSLAWKFNGPLTRLVGLPLAVGVALAEAMTALGAPVRLKWPNDLMKDGAKLAGILVETRSTVTQEVWAVVGVGINLLMPDALEAEIGQRVAAAPWLAQMERHTLMAALLGPLAEVLSEFDKTGFAAFEPRWNQLHAHHNYNVAILDQGQLLHEGRAVGVDASGCLLLDTAQGRVAVSAGDVSLRPVAL